jgi:hypothetical protein
VGDPMSKSNMTQTHEPTMYELVEQIASAGHDPHAVVDGDEPTPPGYSRQRQWEFTTTPGEWGMGGGAAGAVTASKESVIHS